MATAYKAASVRPTEQYRLQGASMVHFVQALSRARVEDIADHLWQGFAGAHCAQGKPQTVTFWPDDLRRIMAALGISHWGENVAVIMDDHGLVFNGWMDGAGFAFQVVLGVSTEEWDGDYPVGRGLRVVPENGYAGPAGMLRFKRSWDPGHVETWAVYEAGQAERDGMNALARFSKKADADRYVRREEYR